MNFSILYCTFVILHKGGERSRSAWKEVWRGDCLGKSQERGHGRGQKAETESKKAEAQAKKADTEAKKADTEAKKADKEAKMSDSDSDEEVGSWCM